MKKSDMVQMLNDIKTGKIKVDDAISKAQTSRGLNWETAKNPLVTGFVYKLGDDGRSLFRIPINRNGYIFQPYYRSKKSAEKLAQKTASKK